MKVLLRAALAILVGLSLLALIGWSLFGALGFYLLPFLGGLVLFAVATGVESLWLRRIPAKRSTKTTYSSLARPTIYLLADTRSLIFGFRGLGRRGVIVLSEGLLRTESDQTVRARCEHLAQTLARPEEPLRSALAWLSAGLEPRVPAGAAAFLKLALTYWLWRVSSWVLGSDQRGPSGVLLPCASSTQAVNL